MPHTDIAPTPTSQIGETNGEIFYCEETDDVEEPFLHTNSKKEGDQHWSTTKSSMSSRLCSESVSRSIYVGVLITTWWLSSAFCILEAKRFLRMSTGVAKLADAASLTTINLKLPSIIYLFYRMEKKILGQASVPIGSLVRRFSLPGVLHFAGNVTTFVVLSLITVSVTQTLKAAEPLFVVGAVALLDSDKYWAEVHGFPLIGVLILIAGVATASFSPEFNLLAMIIACSSSTFFAIRSVVMKKNSRLDMGNEVLREEFKNLKPFDVFGGCCMVACLAATILELTLVVCIGPKTVLHSLERTSSSWHAWVSAVCYTLYNVASFLVLDATSPTSHAVLKGMKGLPAMLGASVLIGEVVSLRVWAGIYIAVVGTLMYDLGRLVKKQKGGLPYLDILKKAIFRIAIATVCVLGVVWLDEKLTGELPGVNRHAMWLNVSPTEVSAEIAAYTSMP